MSDDHDDLIHENTLLASAYLDGEATPDERALMKAVPEVFTEVEELSQVRAVLAATAPASSLSQREGHLARALDVWERMSDLERSGEATPSSGVDAAAAAAVITPVSSSEGRRGRSGRSKRSPDGSFGASQWLLTAAAALVVLVGGAVVVRSFLAGNDTQDAAQEVSADAAQAPSELEAAEAAEVAGDNVGEDYVPSASDLSDDVATNPDGGGGLFDDAAEDGAVEQGEMIESADDSGAAEQPAPAPEVDRVDLETPDDLADYGSLIVSTLEGAPAVTTDIDFEAPGESCEAEFGVEERLEPARYQGEDVFVGVDLDGEIVYAYTESCLLVLSVPLPPTPTQP